MTILEIRKRLENRFPTFQWSTPPDLHLGILTTNQVFIQAKEAKKNPKELAEHIAADINQFFESENLFFKAVIAGPYVNIQLSQKEFQNWIQDYPQALQSLQSFSDNSKPIFGLSQNTNTVLIDYFNCNVAKKIHIGHIRSADIGETLRRILSLSVSKIITAPYLGDWGIQFSYVIWGIEHFDQLSLDFSKPDLENESKMDLINKFYQIYVRVNQILPEHEHIALAAKKLQSELEIYLKNGEKSEDKVVVASGLKLSEIAEYWRDIVKISLEEYHVAENYLNLNKGFAGSQVLFSNEKREEIEQTQLCWDINTVHEDGKFDLFLGESFYIPYAQVFEDLVESGIATRENQAIYVDLESQNLGRCYLLSSEGYSLYSSRDIIARFVWAGLLEADILLSLADNRQNHSFQQVFAVLKLILDSNIYESKPFGLLTQAQTDRAIQILKTRMAEFVGFGFMTLPGGAMSTRKGKIIAFEELKETLENKVKETLMEKSHSDPTPDLIRKVSVATLKWVDLHRDRDQDVVFDFNQFLKFEGNTGVYQLYTVARLHSILGKNELDAKTGATDITLLDKPEEQLILATMYQLPSVLDEITKTYKPHLLCNHLFDLATQINSWYAKYSVSAEQDLDRKAALLGFCTMVRDHMKLGLELLGIEPVESL
jgi:arginyl-tRNA synthetase